MRAVIAGGGTGGHVFPGIAIAEEFKKRDKTSMVFFIGTERGIEARVVPKEGYPIKYISAEGFVGRSPLRRFRAIIKAGIALSESRRLLKTMRPDVVIGTGGYASFAPLLVACFMSLPTLIVEQNLVPGFANKLLSKFVDAIAVAHHESLGFFPKGKTHLTGNPIRAALTTGKREDALRLFSLSPEKFTIFVSGGSLGARKINSAVSEALGLITDLKDKVQFLHQTGEADYEAVKNSYRKFGFSGMVSPFIYKMAEAYAVSDLVIARAGATTLAEITALGIASILIPYPHALGHQEFNAEKLQRAGACRVLKDNSLNGAVLADAIREIYSSKELREQMQKNSKAIGRPDAAQRVVDIAVSLANLRNRGRH